MDELPPWPKPLLDVLVSAGYRRSVWHSVDVMIKEATMEQVLIRESFGLGLHWVVLSRNKAGWLQRRYYREWELVVEYLAAHPS